MASAGQYDVFISYRHKDAHYVDQLESACKACGLAVWRDLNEIEDLESIQNAIENGLAYCKAFVPWYSLEYQGSPACQWELRSAFIAAQHHGHVRDRIYTINPEASEDHIQPIQLRDQLFLKPREFADQDFASMAASIATKVSKLKECLGSTLSKSIPRIGSSRDGFEQFSGRFDELWEIHSALHQESYPMTGAMPSAPLVQIAGITGVGKSRLAQQYGLLFESAFPGGVFWLSASQTSRDSETDSEDQETHIERELTRIADSLHLDIGTRSAKNTLETFFRERQLSFLWVVDDLPPNLAPKAILKWLAPDGYFGKTLITTTASDYEDLGIQIFLNGLRHEDAYSLLTRRRKPKNTSEENCARALVDLVGAHPYALTLAGTAIALYGDLHSYESYLNEIRNPSTDELEFASKLMGTQTRQEETNIGIMLHRSIKLLNSEGHDYLLVASQLANAPLANSLVSHVLAKADKTDISVANRNTAVGCKQAQSLSLLTSVSDSETGPTIHPLIRIAARFDENVRTRAEALRQSAIAVIEQILAEKSPTADVPSVIDPLVHYQLKPHIPHAYWLTVPPTSRSQFQVLMWLAEYERTRGAMGLAIGNYRALLRAGDSVFHGKWREVRLAITRNLAMTLGAVGDLAESLPMRRQVLDESISIWGKKDLRSVMNRHSYGKALLSAGEFARAKIELEAVFDQLEGQETKSTDKGMIVQLGVTVALDMADLEILSGNAATAVRTLEELWEDTFVHVPAGNPDRVRLLNLLADGWLKLLEASKAGKYAERSISDCQQMGYLISHPMYLNALTAQLNALLMANRYDSVKSILNGELFRDSEERGFEALRRIKETVAATLQIRMSNHAEGPITREQREVGLKAQNDLAMNLLETEEYSKATVYLRKIILDCDALYGSNSKQSFASLNNLGFALSNSGEVSEAIAAHTLVLNACSRNYEPADETRLVAAWYLSQDFMAASQTENAVLIFRNHILPVMGTKSDTLAAASRQILKLAAAWWDRMPANYRQIGATRKKSLLRRIFQV
jgi:tetratricopeptide (TPR) repeat protein